MRNSAVRTRRSVGASRAKGSITGRRCDQVAGWGSMDLAVAQHEEEDGAEHDVSKSLQKLEAAARTKTLSLIAPIQERAALSIIKGTIASLPAAALSVHLPTERGDTLLTWAVRHGHTDVVRLLLCKGASIDGVTLRGGTALYIGCQEGHDACVALLIARGAEVGCVNQRGLTPLAVACRNGYSRCAQLLLDAGAAADTVLIRIHRSSITAMYVACQRGRLACVQLLSSHGASRSFDGDTHTADKLCRLMGHAALMEWLSLSEGWTPLHHVEVLSPRRALAMLRAGADPHARAHAGDRTTPVERAAAILKARASSSGRDGSSEDGCSEGTWCQADASCTEVASLIVRASQPWSPQNHALLPDAMRARAVDLLFIGHRLANEGRFAFERGSLLDAWLTCVLPAAVAMVPRAAPTKQGVPSGAAPCASEAGESAKASPSEPQGSAPLAVAPSLGAAAVVAAD